MFGIIKVSRNHKNMSPLCYFQNEDAAVRVFHNLIESSDVRLLLVKDYDPEEKDCSKFSVVEDYRPKIACPKRKYRYHYSSRKEIREENERFKQQEKEAHLKQQTINVSGLSKPEKLPINYYIEKDKKEIKQVFRFQYKLLDVKSNLIFISKIPWPLEYEKEYFKMVKESPHIEGHYIISCFAKNNSEAETFIKQKLKEIFKKKKD